MSTKNSNKNEMQKFDASAMSEQVSGRIDQVYNEKGRGVVFDGARALGLDYHVVSGCDERSFEGRPYFSWLCSETRKDRDGNDVPKEISLNSLSAYASNKGNANLKWEWENEKMPDDVYVAPSGLKPSATAAAMGQWLNESNCHVKIVGRVRNNFGQWIYAYAPAE